MTIAELLELLSKGGLLAGGVLFIVALWRRWLIWRAEFDALLEDRNWWRSIAMTASGLAEIAAKGKKRNETAD